MKSKLLNFVFQKGNVFFYIQGYLNTIVKAK